jgi:hypothetical protein
LTTSTYVVEKSILDRFLTAIITHSQADKS